MKKAIFFLSLLLIIMPLFSCANQNNFSDVTEEITQEQQIEEETASPTTKKKYVASRESNKYHRLSCHYVDQILKENRVYYKTEEAARRAGKSPCSVCSP